MQDLEKMQNNCLHKEKKKQMYKEKEKDKEEEKGKKTFEKPKYKTKDQRFIFQRKWSFLDY